MRGLLGTKLTVDGYRNAAKVVAQGRGVDMGVGVAHMGVARRGGGLVAGRGGGARPPRTVGRAGALYTVAASSRIP